MVTPSDLTVALDRFGLGGRAGETVPEDPRAELLAQLGRFAPRPAPIAALPGRSELMARLGDYIGEARSLYRRQQRAAGNRRDRRAAMAPATAPPMPTAMAGADEEENPVLAGLPEPIRRFIGDSRDVYLQMAAARLAVSLDTPAPFAERLVHFWSNHFAISVDKVPVIAVGGLLEFEAIRPNLLGSFRDMLLAVERHPAMLLYLDQAQSIGPNSRGARLARRFGRGGRGLNENLAREILELHTVGVDVGYTPADVTELARALTGWTVGGLARGPAARLLGGNDRPGEFLFAEAIHEPGDRNILGRSWPDDGEGQAEAVLAALATHPATALHLAVKLARHFAGDEPPPALVDRLARAFAESGGDLPTVYRALIEAPEPWQAPRAKFRTPWDWTVAALRAVGVRELPGRAAAGMLAQLGQPIWRPGSPAGYDDVAAGWAAPDALVRRVQFAERLADRAAGGVDPRTLADQLVPDLGPATREAIARAESPAQGLALLLVSPEFLRR